MMPYYTDFCERAFQRYLYDGQLHREFDYLELHESSVGFSPFSNHENELEHIKHNHKHIRPRASIHYQDMYDFDFL
jgi:hypothetical protein